jgi:hypothetical protein
MDRDEIKVDHCYSMTPIHGRRTIARVTNLFRITAMAAYQETGAETLELNPMVVQFVWRHAAYPTGWSKRRRATAARSFCIGCGKGGCLHLVTGAMPSPRRFPPPWSVEELDPRRNGPVTFARAT